MERTGPLSDEDETRLVRLAALGDGPAFEALVQRRQGPLRLFLRRMTGDAALADDLAQAALLKAWRNLSALREAAAFPAWLRRIAFNLALDALRRPNLLETPLETEPAGPTPGDDHRLDLEAALAALSLPARTCILLHHGEGLSHGEIAAETGIPIGTVKSHIARATARLRSRLAPWRPADA